MATTKVIIKSCYINRTDFIEFVVPKYLKRFFVSIKEGQDAIDNKHLLEKMQWCSAVVVDKDVIFEGKRNKAAFYQTLFKMFEQDTVSRVTSNWGTYVVGRGLLFCNCALVLVKAAVETIWNQDSGNQDDNDIKLWSESFISKYEIYYKPYNDSNDLKSLCKYIEEKSDIEYCINDYNFYE